MDLTDSVMLHGLAGLLSAAIFVYAWLNSL